MNGEKPSDVAAGPGDPKAGTTMRRSLGLQFDQGEESESDIKIIGEDSKDDVINSETESENEKDLRGMVDCCVE